MITNVPDIFPNPVFKIIEQCEFDFYISGSHYWTKNLMNDPSDFVFFVKESTKVEAYLTYYKFIESPKRYDYLMDCDTVKVLTFISDEDNLIIHIQLSKNPKLKIEIQRFLREQFKFQLPGDKLYQLNLWNRMFSFCYETSNLSQSTRIV